MEINTAPEIGTAPGEKTRLYLSDPELYVLRKELVFTLNSKYATAEEAVKEACILISYITSGRPSIQSTETTPSSMVRLKCLELGIQEASRTALVPDPTYNTAIDLAEKFYQYANTGQFNPHSVDESGQNHNRAIQV